MNLSTSSTCKFFCIVIAFLFSTEFIFCNTGIQLLDPPNGSAGQQFELTFTWSGDVSGGTFELQIARDPAFRNLFADVRFITANEYPYQLADEGAYYWRVRKVVDNSANPEEWSAISVFKTISTLQPMQKRPDTKNRGEKQLSSFPLLIPLDGSFTLAMDRNDDESSSLITIPFNFNFFGTNYNQLFINNNGNISFDSPYYEYLPIGFPSGDYRMIAPFWADIDTRNWRSGEVWYKVEPNRLIVIWSDVGYYYENADLLNDFELIITDGTPAGGLPSGMHVCFSYGDMQWTTGDVGGWGGFGSNYPATVGMNRGDGVNYRQIGRFDQPGNAYDGAFGANDGVDWLDRQRIYFRNDYNPPEAICRNVTLGLDWNGSVVVRPEDIDNGSHDNEGQIVSCNVSPNTFNCSSIGTHLVTLTITDDNYNVASCTAEVTIVDNMPPQVYCNRYIRLYLDQNNHASITPEMLSRGNYDNCGIVRYELSKSEFDCDDVGINEVTLIGYDASGNSGRCLSRIFVIDWKPPVAICKNISVELDENGSASIIPQQIDNGSYDNCGIVEYRLSKSTFDCGDVGANTITMMVRDRMGNYGYCSAVVTVLDNIAPTIEVAVSPEMLWPPNHKMATITTTVTYTDNCPGTTYLLTSVTSNEPDNGNGDGDTPNDIQGVTTGEVDHSFDLRKERSGTGTGRIYTITYTAYDDHGNSTAGTAEVVVPHDWDKRSMFENVPSDFLVSSVPNPFSDKTTVVYNLDASAIVGIEILDVLGNKVYTEPKKTQSAGVYSFVWFGIDMSGNALPSGLYFIKLDYGNQSSIVPMTILR